MVALTAIHDWVDAPGVMTVWGPSSISAQKMAHAPISNVPPSYQQDQHIRTYRECSVNGIEMARLLIPVWNMPGRCDIRTMTYVINSHLRRHDTYHSWFEFTDDDRITRRTVADPADIHFVATKYGEMTSNQWREHVLKTPGPLQWDCFQFGVIQRADHFTLYVSIDHLHADAMFMVPLFIELHMNYAALAQGGVPMKLPEAGSYHEYCLRQYDYTKDLSLDTPEVLDWISFLRNNGGTLPKFPLPLGDLSSPCTGDLLTVQLMDEHDTYRFEKACSAEGVRFIGGVFACAAMAHYGCTGAEEYHVITPTTTRTKPEDFLTTGWFTGLVPVSTTVAGKSFGDIAREAQASFDSKMSLAHVPIERVLHLAESVPGIDKAGPGVPMLSYADVGLPPLDPGIVAQWQERNGRIYTDLGAANQIGMWVIRRSSDTIVNIAFPDNPVARESVHRYVELMKCAYLRVVQGRTGTVEAPQLSGVIA